MSTAQQLRSKKGPREEAVERHLCDPSVRRRSGLHLAEEASALAFSQLQRHSTQISRCSLREHHGNSVGCDISHVLFPVLWAAAAIWLKAARVNPGPAFRSILREFFHRV